MQVLGAIVPQAVRSVISGPIFPDHGIDHADHHAELLDPGNLVRPRGARCMIEGMPPFTDFVEGQANGRALFLDNIEQVVDVFVAARVHRGDATTTADDVLLDSPSVVARFEAAVLLRLDSL